MQIDSKNTEQNEDFNKLEAKTQKIESKNDQLSVENNTSSTKQG